MALHNNGSYIPTANEFLAHWAQADAALGAAPLLLPEKKGVIPPNFNRSGLLALRDVLQFRLDEVQDKLNLLQIASGVVNLEKAKLYKRLTLFVELMDGFYTETEFYAARPELPGIGAGEEKFTAALRDMKSLWPKLNAAPAPGGVTLPIILDEGTEEQPQPVAFGAFALDQVNLNQRYADRAEAEQAVKLERSRRDRVLENIRAVLVAYRKAAVTRLAAHESVLATLPRVTPQPGHTPDAVSAQAELVPPDIAQVTHTESDDQDFKEYQLRGTIGEDGDTEDAVVLATHTERTPAPFSTQHGLGLPGGAVSLWVYVITHDGNERASNRMVVQRPL